MVQRVKKVKCLVCGKESFLISSTLKVCAECIREKFSSIALLVEETHRKTRREFDLPVKPPASPEGITCRYCINQCKIGPGERSFCGIRANLGGKLKGATQKQGLLDWYYDNLPTNCVADWVCPGGTGSGFPQFSYTQGPEYGYKNLAVFYHGCSFNCLFCQNWHWRDTPEGRKSVSAEVLADCVDFRTSCICFFGGDPSCQIQHSLEVAKIARQKNRERILRICWETNGSMSREFLDEMAKIALESGGCIKFDLKAWNEQMHIALCGVSNKATLANFSYLASFVDKRPNPPFLVASTLLVPGYVDEKEVRGISRFIASLNPEIPYTLLAFYPQFYMHDLPCTSKSHAQKCKEVAEKEGLCRVRIGNLHLLSDDY